MRALLTIMVSDNGEEIFVYRGTGESYEDLITVRPTGDAGTVANYVQGEIEDLAEGGE